MGSSTWFVAVVAAGSLASCAHGYSHASRGIPDELGRISAEELFRTGVWYASRGDLFRAEQYLKAAEERGHPPRPTVNWLLRVCVSANRYRAALMHARRYLRGDPSDPWIRFVAATIYIALGEHDRAVTELHRVVEIAPHQSLPHYYLGLLYRERLGEEQASINHLREYVRLAPGGPHALEATDLLTLQEVRR